MIGTHSNSRYVSSAVLSAIASLSALSAVTHGAAAQNSPDAERGTCVPEGNAAALPFAEVVKLTAWDGLEPTRMVYIDASAPLGGDGSSWNSAYQSLHDALNAESFVDDVVEIRVAGGIYRADRVNGVDTLDPNLSYESPGLVGSFPDVTGLKRIAGGFAGRGAPNPDERDIELYPTVFTGDLLGDDTPEFGNYADNTKVMFSPRLTELDGLTIEHGRIAVLVGQLLTDCTVRRCYASAEGQSLDDEFISPVTLRQARVVGSHFLFNKGETLGGAVRPLGTVAIANSVFIGNHAVQGGAIGADNFGALYLQNSFCAGNVADGPQGGLGGAVFVPTNIEVVHCTFVGNLSVGGGGHAAVSSQGPLKMYNSIIDQNYAYNGTGLFADVIGNRDASSAVLSIIRGNLFREYNENVETSPNYTGIGLNAEAVPGFADLFGADGEFGTSDDDPSLGAGSDAIGRSVSIDFPEQVDGFSALRDLADLDGDCDVMEAIPVDFFGNPRAIAVSPGEGLDENYPADAGCVEFVPDSGMPNAAVWTVPNPDITDESTEPIRLYVRVDAAPGGDGSSWASALSNPSEALAIAAGRIGPVEIWVAAGEYAAPITESGIEGFQMVENATLLGGFEGTETDASERDPSVNITVLTGDRLGNDAPPDNSTLLDNTRQVVISIGRRGGGVIDGFTIRDASPRRFFFGIGYFTTAGDGLHGENSAALVYAASGELVVRNCTLGPTPLKSVGFFIGARSMAGLDGERSNLSLENCRFMNDRDIVPVLTTSIDARRERRSILPPAGWGELRVADCVIDVPGDRNILTLDHAGPVTVSRSHLVRGSGPATWPIVQDSALLRIEDSSIVSASPMLMRFQSTQGELRNTTMLVPNLSITRSGVGFPLSIHNTIFASGNSALISSQASGMVELTVTSSTFPESADPGTIDGYGPANTVFDFESSAAQFFLDPLGPDGEPYTGDEDLRLAPGSPAINTGLNAFVDSEFDLDGNDRTIAHVVDRGAYEFTGTCTGDVNGDGVIDLRDLNRVLGNFGQPVPFGDADGSGSVDMTDLNIVISAFGSACDG